MKFKSPYLVEPHAKVRLSRLSTSEHPGYDDKDSAEPALAKLTERLSSLQEVLSAGRDKAVLIVLQGMDTAGKDGAIRHIFSGINPQGCQVASFKAPTDLEARHDFLWRCHQQVPPLGMIGIFNRSHYEDVLWPRVHGSMSTSEMRRRLDHINAWESMLSDSGVLILKFFLHISRKEQTERLQARIDTPEKHWKLAVQDFSERRLWRDYMSCYEDLLARSSHKHAPWFVIPADNKWFRDVTISHILVEALDGLKLRYPEPAFDPKGMQLDEESLSSAERKVHKRSAKKPSTSPA